MKDSILIKFEKIEERLYKETNNLRLEYEFLDNLKRDMHGTVKRGYKMWYDERNKWGLNAGCGIRR